MQIDRLNEQVALTDFMAGLQKGDFLFTLSKEPLESMSELMYETQKLMNGEDALNARDSPPSKKTKEIDDRHRSDNRRFE